ncbi:hypothetical protein ACFRAQ_34860 [Nocardia sp. NPDC056611]|uniref:hypothetical protein n=1 Tax=Nocardia sp. NPDC056611 TaxID=3345877 RepID=UPI0036714F10
MAGLSDWSDAELLKALREYAEPGDDWFDPGGEIAGENEALLLAEANRRKLRY